MLKYYPSLVDELDPESEIAVITLWTKKEIVKKSIKNYRYLGQLYSSTTGVFALFRNCLFDKKIRHIAITGSDLSGSGEVLKKFFNEGLEGRKIRGTDIVIEEEIPLERLEMLRKNVTFHDFRDMADYSGLNALLEKISMEKKGSYGLPELFPEHEIKKISQYPSDHSGFIVKDSHIGNAWLKIISNVMRFGYEKESSYNELQKELLNLTCVIYEEDPDSPKIEPYFRFTADDLKRYYPQIITPESFKGIEYTYGSRMRRYKGIDQVEDIIDKLKKEPFSRRAVALSWDVEKDIFGEMSPCLMLVQAVIQQNFLFLTAYFRSNDMFDAWPKNAFGLRKLQKSISEKLDIKPGCLTIISCSAHIYKRNYEEAMELIEKNQIRDKIYDPNGNLVIYVDKDIHIRHENNEGYLLAEYKGKSASGLFRKLSDNLVISKMGHAFDIGAELQKAQIALEKNIEYRQDQKLKI